MTSNSTLRIEAKVKDWRYQTPWGVKKTLPPGTTEFSCSKWLVFSPVDFTIAPGKSQVVSYTLNAPQNASGGYVTLLDFMGSDAGFKAKEGVSVKLALHMGSFLAFEIAGTQKPKMTIVRFEAPGASSEQPFDVLFHLKNEGNIRMEAKGRLAIMDERGNAAGWVKVPDVKALPNDEWDVKASWDAPLAPGRYKMVATFELSSGGILIKEKELVVK